MSEPTDLDELLGSVTQEGEPHDTIVPPPSKPPSIAPQGETKEPKAKGKPGPKPKAKAESAPPQAPAVEAPKFFVAKGKSISTRSRGIVDSGKEVFPADFSEGEKRLEELTTAGYLVKS